jgi:hypothetical protein
MWLRALTAAVNSNLGQFESGSLLEVLTALQKLQAGRRTDSSSIRRAGLAAAGLSGSGSSSSSIVPFVRRQVQQAPQSSGSQVGGNVSSSSSSGRVRPAGFTTQVIELRNPLARQRQQQQQRISQHDREAELQLEGMFGMDSSSSGFAPSLRQQQSAAATLQELDAAAAEAYSMACLVVLMPGWLQSKVAQWPKHMAADRAALQQQQQQQRELQMSAAG